MTALARKLEDGNAHWAFAGMMPTRGADLPERRDGIPKGALATVPIVLAGAMVGAGFTTGPVAAAEAAPAAPQSPQGVLAATTVSSVSAASAVVATATSYAVQKGDTVSAIASRHGLSTAAVLALNGLGWRSLIFPGQVLRLSSAPASAPAAATAAPVVSTPAPATTSTSSGSYTIVRGDTVSGIASRFGLSTSAVLSANGLGWSSIIYPGQKLTIPGRTAPASVAITPVSSVTPTAPATTTPPAASTAPATPATTPAPSAPVSTPTTQKSGSYTILRGDTLTSIARTYGVTVQNLLDANGLSLSSIIYAGRTLTIPGVVVASPGITALSSEMATNAAVIIKVGRQLNVPDYGIVVALSAAMQESSLRNINYGDRDSVGLFQQRPSTGWGTVADIMVPEHAAQLFYVGNPGLTRGLLGVPGWQSMSVTRAAQAVQISAFPDAYAKWETSARAWLAQLG